tara:strand:- start:45 stop:365 length:321 start_codon:yes stop_codon:yes gene_type:complete
MKKIFNILIATIFISLLFSSCTKTKYGDVTFWQKTGSGYGITVVSLEGVTSNITSEYGSTPDCGSSGCAVFNNIETGTYNYGASDGTDSWSGSVRITERCLTMELY